MYLIDNLCNNIRKENNLIKMFLEEKFGMISFCVDNIIYLDFDSSDDQIYIVDKSGMFVFIFYILFYMVDVFFLFNVNNVEIF